jgi:hypothetical protein
VIVRGNVDVLFRAHREIAHTQQCRDQQDPLGDPGIAKR